VVRMILKRSAYVLLAAFMAYKTLAIAASDLLAEAYPSFALWFDSQNAPARLATARELVQASGLEQDPKHLRQEALDQVQQAIKSNPFTPGALSLLSEIAGEGIAQEDRRRLMNLALRVTQRDLPAQVWLLTEALKENRPDAAAERIKQIFKGQTPANWSVLLPQLVPIMLHPSLQPRIVEWFAADEKWRLELLPRLAQIAPNVTHLAGFYVALRESAVRPGYDLSRPFLDRLVKEGFLDAAYNFWLQLLPAERLSRLGYLYNGNFQYPLTNVPFDWVFANMPGFLAEVTSQDSRSILNVNFFGNRIDFRHVSHLLRLPPGRYALAGLVRAQGLENEVGLRWRVHCVGEGQTNLGASPNWSGSFDWTPFRVSFDVPADCKYQNLVLELPKRVALDTVITGGISFTNISLDPSP